MPRMSALGSSSVPNVESSVTEAPEMDEQIHQAEASIQQAKAAVDQAEANFERGAFVENGPTGF